jgi:hypothetical protein
MKAQCLAVIPEEEKDTHLLNTKYRVPAENKNKLLFEIRNSISSLPVD